MIKKIVGNTTYEFETVDELMTYEKVASMKLRGVFAIAPKRKYTKSANTKPAKIKKQAGGRKYKAYTAKEIKKFKQLLKDGRSIRAIGRELGRTKSAIIGLMRREGLIVGLMRREGLSN